MISLTDPPPEMMIIGHRAYALLRWYAEEDAKWSGRDWRRIKRERRKFLARFPKVL